MEDTPRFARLLDIIEDMNMDPLMTLTKWYGIEGEHWEFEEINGVKTVHQFGNNAPAEEGGGNWFNWTPGSVYYWEMRYCPEQDVPRQVSFRLDRQVL